MVLSVAGCPARRETAASTRDPLYDRCVDRSRIRGARLRSAAARRSNRNCSHTARKRRRESRTGALRSQRTRATLGPGVIAMTSAAVVQHLTGRAEIAIVFRFVRETLGTEEWTPLNRLLKRPCRSPGFHAHSAWIQPKRFCGVSRNFHV